MQVDPRCRCIDRGCIHYTGMKFIATDDPVYRGVVCHCCPAFPEGIPIRIGYETDDHLSVASDQTGTLVFEKK